MPVEDPADLAGMFDVADHGTAATWLPGAGGSFSAVVIFDRPEGDGMFDAPRGNAFAASCQVLRNALPDAPLRNDQLTIAAGRFAGTWAVAEAFADQTGEVFTLRLRKV